MADYGILLARIFNLMSLVSNKWDYYFNGPNIRQILHKVSEFLHYVYTQGYLLIPDFFKPGELDPVRKGIAEAVDILTEKLYKAGKIKGMLEKHEVEPTEAA